MEKSKFTLAIAVIAWLPTHWLLLSRCFGSDALGLAYSAAAAAIVILVGKCFWKIYSDRRVSRKLAKERKEKKVRLWNKLEGLGTAMNNSKKICIMDYFQLRQHLREAKVEAIDAVEAFQAKSLLLDVKYSKIHEMVYDADVNAFLLAGRESELSIPAATFYYNSELKPCKGDNLDDNDGQSNPQQQEKKPVIEELVNEGALPIAIVQKGIELATSLLLQHGAHFYIGQFEISKLAPTISAIVKKPIFATILTREAATGNFLVILSCEATLPSLVAACLMPQFKRDTEQPVQSKQRVGYIFIHQRKSEALGKRLDESDVSEMLSTAGEELVDFDSKSLLSLAQTGSTQQVKAEIDRVLSDNSFTGLVVVCGTEHKLIQHAATFMEISIFSLTDHLTEVYLCHQYEHTASALKVAQSFGKAIKL